MFAKKFTFSWIILDQYLLLCEHDLSVKEKKDKYIYLR